MIDWAKAAPLLDAKLNPSHVKERTQGGARVSYVEGWHAIAEANRIFGHGGWTRETIELRCVTEREAKIGRDQKPGWRVTYTCRVRVTVGDVFRDGCGAGHGIGTDLGECHESALKEAETDAMKRAFMTFGNPFGLALYDKSRENVGFDEPPFDPDAAEARIVAALGRCRTLSEVAALARDEAATVRLIGAEGAARIKAAADARRAQIAGQDPAMQAPAA